MSTPSDQRRAVAKHTLQVFKGELKVQVYYDDNRTLSVELLTTPDSVHKGVKSIGSICLSEISLLDADGDEFGTRVELCAAALTPEIYWENAVASAAFYSKTQRSCDAWRCSSEHISGLSARSYYASHLFNCALHLE